EVILGGGFEILLFTVLITTLFYNITEATFDRLNILWVFINIVVLYNSASYEPMPELTIDAHMASTMEKDSLTRS
ncbi:hypothetical protein HGA64_05640, partial [Candidatus Falkowbacteria bacterium]|nr:hypothetical protein [Candidatus Falkowbacteria bacterium]